MARTESGDGDRLTGRDGSGVGGEQRHEPRPTRTWVSLCSAGGQLSSVPRPVAPMLSWHSVSCSSWRSRRSSVG